MTNTEIFFQNFDIQNFYSICKEHSISFKDPTQFQNHSNFQDYVAFVDNVLKAAFNFGNVDLYNNIREYIDEIYDNINESPENEKWGDFIAILQDILLDYGFDYDTIEDILEDFAQEDQLYYYFDCE